MADDLAAAAARPPDLLRVVVFGSESTGKTTLAKQLATHYQAPLACEFVRQYAEVKRAPLEVTDVEAIAHGQLASEREAEALAVRHASPLVILDTDLNSTVVYSRHYYGDCPSWIDDAARARRADLYLLLSIDVPWVADTQRDRGGRRPEMHALFQNRLAAIGARCVEVSGNWAARFARATAAIDDLVVAGERARPHRRPRPD